MKTTLRLVACGVYLASALLALSALGATNTWTGASGAWQDGTQWSLGVPPSRNDHIDFITNAGVRTVVVDYSTSHMYPSTMGISNLTLSVPFGTNGLNTLYLSNTTYATPLNITNSLTVGLGGALYLSNSALAFPAPGVSSLYDDGQVTLSNSWIYATNAFPLIFIANSPGNTNGSLVLNGGGIYGFYLAVGHGAGAKGSLTINDGLVSFPFFATNLVVGSSGSAGGTLTVNGGQVQANITTIGAGASGTVTMQGGSFSSSMLTIGYAPGGTGVVSVFGGQLLATNLVVGFYNGDGTLVVGSNGVVAAAKLLVASNDLYTSHAHGTVVVQPGGTLNVTNGNFLVGAGSGSTGAVSVVGGTLAVTNGILGIGNGGDINSGTGTGSMLVSNATVTAASVMLGSSVGGSGDLIIDNGGTVTVLGGLMGYDAEVKQGGSLEVVYRANSFAFEDPNLHNRIVIGYKRNAALKMTGGKVLAPEIVIGLTNGTGSLNLTNGSVTVSNLLVGLKASGTGVVNIVGGTLTATNGVVQVGPAGSGQVNISGGSTAISQLLLGGTNSGAVGGLHMTGGHLRLLSLLRVNAFDLGGGDLDGTGGTVVVGDMHDGSMTVSGGMATNIGSLLVGYSPGRTGTFAQDGGYVSVVTNVVVGDCASGAVGNVTLNGGYFFAQNADHNAVFNLRNGTVVLNPGAALIVDTLVLTNSCGHFTHNGGYISYNQLVLAPDAPPLMLKSSFNSGDSSLTLWWPSLYVGYFLQENPDLSPGNWSAVGQTPTDNGTTRSVTIRPVTDNRFYRLCKPE
jgi:hypothetical protein